MRTREREEGRKNGGKINSKWGKKRKKKGGGPHRNIGITKQISAIVMALGIDFSAINVATGYQFFRFTCTEARIFLFELKRKMHESVRRKR